MKQIYILVIYSPSGLKSKEMEFNSLYFLFDYIKKYDCPGFDKYEITKKVTYVKD